MILLPASLALAYATSDCPSKLFIAVSATSMNLLNANLSLFKTAFRKVNFEIVRLPHDCILHHWFATGGTSALATILVVYRSI